jgi:plasmid stability protein
MSNRQLFVSLSDEIRDRLKIMASEQKRSVSGMARAIIEDALSGNIPVQNSVAAIQQPTKQPEPPAVKKEKRQRPLYKELRDALETMEENPTLEQWQEFHDALPEDLKGVCVGCQRWMGIGEGYPATHGMFCGECNDRHKAT